MLVYNRNGTAIEANLFPKKNKAHTEKYTIYIIFYAKSKGVNNGIYEMSSGINVFAKQLDNSIVKGNYITGLHFISSACFFYNYTPINNLFC